ncbi:hypothetical protein GGQ74_002247 [Desulfobaculum xiamenense]|uniref:Uncharacterized protein n=1 Tax=Desulfobaculum xiamenense TaxID=995050 RepID=A0A846QTS8_9BACT|nr:hypothetical protein [Desulfobaculum xiamenense]NJB68574.1 hypothetical protein [Desulfobaculum xiamenense]
MQKREIILICIMGVAILYGGYTLLFQDTASVRAKGKDIAAADLKAMIKDMRSMVAKERPSELDMYKLSLAEGTEMADPFLKLPKADLAGQEENVVVTTNSTDYVYSGYVEFNRRKLAIINGEEFGIGEHVDENGCAIITIGPDTVRLERTDPASGMREQIIVPIREDIITFTEDRNAQRIPQ